jgi:hypothetical protein
MKKMDRFYRLNLIVVLNAVLLFTLVSPVQASAGGQQIRVSACSAVRVVIQGKNLSGTSVTYTLNKAASDCGFTNIPGWWWNGTISATAYYNVTSEYPFFKGQSVSATISTPQQNFEYYSVTVPTPTARQWIIWRAQTWVNDNVAYNQNSTHDGYREDCTGYVVFAWQLKKPGTSPSGLSVYSYQIPFDSLQPGDALNNPSAHSILFVKWVNQSKGTFIAYQEEFPGKGTRQATLTLNKSTGAIMQGIYYTYPGYYKAMRKNGF